jgi:nucleotide-binding universal stress UspA family protein
MNVRNLNLLLVTNGFEGTRPALDYGLWLAGTLGAHVTLLSVEEADNAHHPVGSLVAETVQKLETAGVKYEAKVQKGHAEEVVSAFAKEGEYLVVLGPLGRPPLLRFVMGRSFRYFMAEIASPLLYVPQTRTPVHKILVCMGGLEYALGPARLALRFAPAMKASITFLHVVEPITMEYPLAHEVKTHWQHLLDTNTPQGRVLRQVLEESQPLGLPTSVKVRHGDVVPEILAEIKEGDYDLLCMGSAYSAHSLRHLYLPNVTADVAEAVHCPVLTARYTGSVNESTNPASPKPPPLGG